MKYRDESGKIVIDSNEADADIRKLKQAAAMLEEIRAASWAAEEEGSFWLGDARVSYDKKVSSIDGSVKIVLQAIQEAIEEIQKTVDKYKEIDKAMAAQFTGLAGGALKWPFK